MNAITYNRESPSLFGPGKFYVHALSLAVPIMLQSLIQSMVSLIDNFMVSGLGDISMSGVNVAGQIMFVFMVYLNTICMAGGIFLTQFSGADDKEGMQQAFRFKLAMGFAAIIPYLFVCLICPRQVLGLMLIGNTQASAILDQAVEYIGIMFFIGAQMTISVCIASSLRDMVEVKLPLMITVVATLTNTFFNWLLIYGNLGMPRLEVRGAAIATVIARTVELILFLFIYIKKRPDFSIRLRELPAVNGKLFREILKKGSLVLFCELVWVFSETITTAIYNGRGGADVVSGMSAGFAIANLVFVAFGGIYSSTGVVLGKTLGQGKLEEARRQKTWLISGSMVFGVFMGLLGLATTLLIPVVFGKLSVEAQTICRHMVVLIAVLMPFWVIMNAQQAVARAGGDTAMGAYTDAAITIVVVIPLIFALGIFTTIGPVLMYGLIKISDCVKVIIFQFWLKKERWLKNLTVTV